jgi:hypothetical protein
VPIDWLERLLATAAAYGLLNRSKCKGQAMANLQSATQQQQQQQVSAGKHVDIEGACVCRLLLTNASVT